MSNQPLTDIFHNISLSETKITNIDLSLDDLNVSNTPIKLNDTYVEDSERLAHILNSVLVMFAYNYSRDERLQQIYQVNKDLHNILLMSDGTPYELGMYKTQFWYDETGQAKIGEFNCRNAVKSFLESCKVKKAAFDTSDNNVEKCLSEFTDRYDKDDTLYMIRDDNDSLLINELEKSGMKVKDVKPSDFQLTDGKLMVDNEIARQFYLDVDREELVSFDQEILKAIITSGRCINDVRTLILIQDRRTFAVLNSDQIMGSYINLDDHQFLSKFLSPVYLIQTKEDQQTLTTSNDNWVLKKNNPSKENDILEKNATSKEVWDGIIMNDWYQYIVCQDLKRKQFDLSAEEKAEIMGADIFFNGKSYGPGLFTATSNNGERSLLVPIVE